MSHQHAETNIGHSHLRLMQNTVRGTFLQHMHDTDLWASHIPRVPLGLYLLALFGFALGLASFTSLMPASPLLKFSTLIVGLLLIIPAMLARHFAISKWSYVSNVRKQIFEALTLRGDENVLDVGCGSGTLLNAAAQQLTTGKALGIDIWAPHTGGGNYDLLLKNAKAEGVANKIEFKQADVRQLPFEDASFDIIVSSGALHHIGQERSEHEQAIHEMVRVLKPGGKIALMDVSHMIEEYAVNMKTMGIASKVHKTVQSPFGFEMSVMIGKKDK